MLEYLEAKRVCETQLTENDFSRKFMTSLEISEVTGKQHTHVMRDIRNLLKQGVSESNFGLSSYKQTQPNGGCKDIPCYKLTQKGCLILASGYNAVLREKIINRWVALETGKESPYYQVNTTTQPKTITLKDQMMWVKEVSKVLKLNDASTLGLYQKVAEPHGQQLPLPDYTPSKGVLKSASELLKANNISMSAHQFNIAMMKAGYIEEQTRKTNGGKEKRFKSITKKGLEFGENQVSPHNPLETQPLYYVDKFVALVNKLQLN